ncbi:MAG: hypothetical protein IJZ26_00610 [Clostridia bacterium]|nr:hypothetical protein [Clostridia bacterium]
MEKVENIKWGLNRNILKYIAVIAMLLDHIALMLIPAYTALWVVLRVIGRLTAPIMCYFLAQGFFYTSNKFKYGLRLFIFALISQFAYTFAFFNSFFVFDFNFIFTLFLCFLMLGAYTKILNPFIKWACVILIILLTYPCDWGLYAPLLVLMFYILKDYKQQQIMAFVLITLLFVVYQILTNVFSNISIIFPIIQLGLLLFIPVIYLYNQQSGSKNRFHKWFFYIFYPLHLIVLGILNFFI